MSVQTDYSTYPPPSPTPTIQLQGRLTEYDRQPAINQHGQDSGYIVTMNFEANGRTYEATLHADESVFA